MQRFGPTCARRITPCLSLGCDPRRRQVPAAEKSSGHVEGINAIKSGVGDQQPFIVHGDVMKIVHAGLVEHASSGPRPRIDTAQPSVCAGNQVRFCGDAEPGDAEKSFARGAKARRGKPFEGKWLQLLSEALAWRARFDGIFFAFSERHSLPPVCGSGVIRDP